jgi:hypothetical protein
MNLKVLWRSFWALGGLRWSQWISCFTALDPMDACIALHVLLSASLECGDLTSASLAISSLVTVEQAGGAASLECGDLTSASLAIV